MSRLFISHAGDDNAWARRVRDWLAENGWNEVFLDTDPNGGIAPGDNWKRTLQRAASQCELVIALVSARWVASPWCQAEIRAARMLNKKVIVALIGLQQEMMPSDLADEQWVDLANDQYGFLRLKEGLKRAGLDPGSFEFEAGRRPYPGFAALEEQDAAIFFGRDAEIVRAMDKLRGMAQAGAERLLVIIGASGAGKSSFMRAGLWPRLDRDDRSWLPLPVIRPERAAITGSFGLSASLYKAISREPFAGELRKRGLQKDRAQLDALDCEAFVTLLNVLRDAGDLSDRIGLQATPPTIVIPIDQGEELFGAIERANSNDSSVRERAEAAEARHLIGLITGALEARADILVVIAMRSDGFPQLQSFAEFAACPKDTFTLDMMLEGSFRAVIEGPAKISEPRIHIDPQLTQALLKDASDQDALPLLAFTLERLFTRHRIDNRLTLEGYTNAGSLRGIIEAAANEAIMEGQARGLLSSDMKSQLTLVRKAFIPQLARVNAAGDFVRRVAVRGEIPEEAQPILDLFVDARLLIKDLRSVKGIEQEIFEVAHEALLREWRELRDALTQERDFLIGKGQLEQDILEWSATPIEERDGALLSGNKLARAKDWLVSRPHNLTSEERQYIEFSISKDEADKAEDARREMERLEAQKRIAQRTTVVAISIALLAIVAAASSKLINDAVNQKNQLSNIADERLAVGLRVIDRKTTLDFSQWRAVSLDDYWSGNTQRRSLVVSHNWFRIKRTRKEPSSFIHIYGTASNVDPIFSCSPVKCLSKASPANGTPPNGVGPREFVLSFDLSHVPIGATVDISFDVTFVNAFQCPQEVGGIRMLHDTEAAVFRIIYPKAHMPIEKNMRRSFVENNQEGAPPSNDPFVVKKAPEGFVESVSWTLIRPITDRVYLVRWQWDAGDDWGALKTCPPRRESFSSR